MTHQVTVQPSGRSFNVDIGESILAAALRNGVVLPYGCKNGSCGSCKGQMLEGQIDQGPHAESALSEAEKASGKALFCCALPCSDVIIQARELTGFGDIPVRKMPCRISRIERPTADVAIVDVQLPGAERLQFRAGQYLQFILRNGERRSYSIATAPQSDEPISFHIRHTPGGLFTDPLFGTPSAVQAVFKARDILRAEGPLGTFFLREDDPRPIVLLASGTGFAPIKAIAEHIFFKRLNRDEPGKAARSVVLFWGGRSLRDLYLHALPQQWKVEQPNFTYVPVLSEPSPDEAWSGRTGFVHQAVMKDWPDLSGHQVYACGAPVMVDAARRDFTAVCGLPAAEFFADAFTTQADLLAAAKS